MRSSIDHVTARDLLMARVSPVGTEQVALSLSAGRVLARDLIAAENIPPFDRSPYDGYAFRAADTEGASREHPVELTVLEEVAAGAVPTRPVTPGTACKILTGAPIPEGADAVRMYERTEFTQGTVRLFAPARPGENIVRAGEDVRAGTVLARSGCVIDAGVAGTLCAQGEALATVYRRARIGLISTGNEVVEADAPLAPGKIRNANRSMLEAALRDARAGRGPQARHGLRVRRQGRKARVRPVRQPRLRADEPVCDRDAGAAQAGRARRRAAPGDYGHAAGRL